MRKATISKDGQLNYIKLALLAVLFSLSTAIFVKLIESASIWINTYLPFITTLVILLGIIHLVIMVINDLSVFYRFIYNLFVMQPLKKPFQEVSKKDIVELNRTYQNINSNSIRDTSCVFRC
jgi:uncharacterized protein involved in cysteine biosynthesis